MSAPTPPPLPVVLQLAPLPRTQIGPFLLLGLDKDAERETIEASWAERVKWARRNLIPTPLEDVNWAREMLATPDQQLRSDAVSLNVDTAEGTLRQLRRQFQGQREGSARARPLDEEKSLAGYTPPVVVPSTEEVRAAIKPPEPPREVPAVRVVLENFVRAKIDPWLVDLDS